VTVVVPTKDRADALGRCLDALERQQGCGELEVIVVDDGSNDLDAVSHEVARSSRARLVLGSGAGAAAARNAGISEASHDVVCFTDDDCLPAADWAARLALATAGGGAAAGRVVNGRARDSLASATQAIVDYVTLSSRDGPDRLRFAPSNNLACRLRVLEEIRFDETYSRSGAEDRDFCGRLVAGGHEIRYVADAVVEHDPSLDLRRFIAKHYLYGRGAMRYRGGRVRGLEPASYYLGLIRAGFRAGWVVGVLVCVAQAATAAGFFRERAGRHRPSER
jgi:glycosyltransferase involved in cell wall biosynthesis